MKGVFINENNKSLNENELFKNVEKLLKISNKSKTCRIKSGKKY